jgi:hypothetical protein
VEALALKVLHHREADIKEEISRSLCYGGGWGLPVQRVWYTPARRYEPMRIHWLLCVALITGCTPYDSQKQQYPTNVDEALCQHARVGNEDFEECMQAQRAQRLRKPKQ